MKTLIIGEVFEGYEITSVLSNKYDYRRVYAAKSEEGDKVALICYDMNVSPAPVFELFGMEVPSEFYYSYHLQKSVTPEVLEISEVRNRGGHRICWMSEMLIKSPEFYGFVDIMCTKPDRVMGFLADCCDCCSAIASLTHGGGHYNIIPEHVLFSIDEDGRLRPYLVGLSHMGEPIEDDPWFDDRFVTSPYRDPESVNGGFSEKSDIFSMAIVMYEILYHTTPWTEGNVPFSRDTQSEPSLSFYHLSGVKNVDGAPLLPLFCKAFDLVDRRYASMSLLKSDLEKCQKIVGKWQLWDDLLPKLPTVDKAEEDDGSSESWKGRHIASQPQVNLTFTVKDGDGFSAVAGMTKLKEELQSNLINVLKNPRLAEKYNIMPPNGMLLYGPPGCGKTYLAQRLAEEAGINVSFVRPSDLGSSYIHGSQSLIADLFDKAAAMSPTMLVFDEIDALVPQRSSHEVSISGEVNEFLTQLESCSKRGIFVVGTTNRIDNIDPAVLRTGRIEEMVYVPLPDKENRKALLQMELKRRPCRKNVDIERLAEMLDNYTMSDISYVVKKASRMAFENTINASSSRMKLIDMSMLEDVISTTSPSVCQSDIFEYENQRKKHENRSASRSEGRKAIGFMLG